MRIPLVLWAAIQCSGGRQAGSTRCNPRTTRVRGNVCEPSMRATQHRRKKENCLACRGGHRFFLHEDVVARRSTWQGKKWAAAGLSPRSRRRRSGGPQQKMGKFLVFLYVLRSTSECPKMSVRHHQEGEEEKEEEENYYYYHDKDDKEDKECGTVNHK